MIVWKGGDFLEYKNPLISVSLTDQVKTRHSDDGCQEVYTHDCHNLPICKSYGNHFFSCLAGANYGTRCGRGEKIIIRILNDINPHAIHHPKKPDASEILDYING
jgi:hypothetical protein